MRGSRPVGLPVLSDAELYAAWNWKPLHTGLSYIHIRAWRRKNVPGLSEVAVVTPVAVATAADATCVDDGFCVPLALPLFSRTAEPPVRAFVPPHQPRPRLKTSFCGVSQFAKKILPK